MSGRDTLVLGPKQNSGGCNDYSAESCSGGYWPSGQRLKEAMIWPGLPGKGIGRKTWTLGTPLGLVHWKRASSPVEAGTAGYL